MRSHPHDEVIYVAPESHHREALRAMARRSFAETFGHRYEPGPFRGFLDRAYGPDGTMARDLLDPEVRWLAGFAGAEPVGYAKLTPLRAPTAAPLPGALELQQIYVLSGWHGAGVADRMMNWALATAASDQAPEVYLTVFDHNERARRFYRRYGFTEVGRCTFALGGRIDDDRVWRLRLR